MPARTELVTDPDIRRDLELARLGTAYFRRVVDRLSDDDLDGASLLPGWSRRHVLAHVGYNARAIARLIVWAATGIRTPMYSSPQARAAEIDLGATLNAEALRNLVEHAAVDLDVRWRDLPDDRWSQRVTTARRMVPVSETVWMRTREVWLHAIDLRSTAHIDEIPEQVLQRLVTDIHQVWTVRGLVSVPSLQTSAGHSLRWESDTGGPLIEGSLPALTAWASGRMPAHRFERDLRWVRGRPQPPPPWI